jgi:hypothetical protein
LDRGWFLVGTEVLIFETWAVAEFLVEQRLKVDVDFETDVIKETGGGGIV